MSTVLDRESDRDGEREKEVTVCVGRDLTSRRPLSVAADGL